MTNNIIEDVANYILQSNVDTYIYIGGIDTNIQVLRENICKHPNKKDEVDLFLTTLGGDPEWAYRLVSLLRTYYKKINVIIPGLCKSAGTLIALGADTLRFHEYGELGPLDVQMKRKDNILGLYSGLDVFQSLSVINDTAAECFNKMFVNFLVKSDGSISTEMAAKIAKDLSVGIYSSVASKIDPLELGEKNRAMKIAETYGVQLASLTEAPNTKQGTLKKLIEGYPSHRFVIDMKQAEGLFNNVQKMTDIDYKIYEIYKEKIMNPCGVTIVDLNYFFGNLNTTSNHYQNDNNASDTQIIEEHKKNKSVLTASKKSRSK